MSSPFQKKFSNSSPLLQGAYESAADSDVYLSTQPQQQQLQNALTGIGVTAAKEFSKPKNKAERQDKRVTRRDKRLESNPSWSEKKKKTFQKTTDKVERKSIENKKQAKQNAIKNRPVRDKEGRLIKYKDVDLNSNDSDQLSSDSESYFDNGGWTDTVTTEEDRIDYLADRFFGKSNFK
jgi:uncharacterized protein (DUF3084 family)